MTKDSQQQERQLKISQADSYARLTVMLLLSPGSAVCRAAGDGWF